MPSTVPTSLEEIRRVVSRDYLRATDSLYWINPKAATGDDEEQADVEDDDESLASGGSATALDDEEGQGLVRFRLYSEQRRLAAGMLEDRKRGRPIRCVIVKCRQSGFSTYSSNWLFHHVYWVPRRNGLIVAHHETTTNALYGMVRTYYAELPPELQWRTEKLNRKELSFLAPHGGKIIAQTAGYIDIGHGLTIHHAHLSEIDRWPDPETALEGIMETVPDQTGTTIIIESVAQGADGWLHHFWEQSVKGESGFTPFFSPWYFVPDYQRPVDGTFVPTEEEFEWIQRFKLTARQIMWYRRKKQAIIAREPWGGERRMKALYPFTAEEAFQSSGLCVFPDQVLERLRENLAPPICGLRLDPTVTPGEFSAHEVHPDTPHSVQVWKKPEEGRYYALGVDIGGGVGQSDSVVSICAYPGFEQVAEWASDRSSAEHTAYVARWLAEYYSGQGSVIAPEVNKDGPFVLYLLTNMSGSFSLFRWRYLDRPGMATTDQPKLGWETNDSTKKILVQVANTVFQRGEGTIRSRPLHKQMLSCVDISPNRWAAKSAKSDRVIGWLIAMTACFLDYEQASVGGIVSETFGVRDRITTIPVPPETPCGACPHVAKEHRGKCLVLGCSCPAYHREASSYDDGDEVFGRRVVSQNLYQAGDSEEDYRW